MPRLDIPTLDDDADLREALGLPLDLADVLDLAGARRGLVSERP